MDWPEAVGLNKGAQDTIVKPAMAPLIDAKRRSTAFGVFDTCFGSAWLVGSIALGLMYARSLATLTAISVVGQTAVVAAVCRGSECREACEDSLIA